MMAYFIKGQGLVNTTYKSEFDMRSANVTFVAGNMNLSPLSSGVDGFSSVSITDNSIGKAMITDPASVTEISLPNNYLAIGDNAFAGLPNLASVYIYAGQEITIGNTPFATGASVTIYVDYAFLTDYQTDYPSLTFAGFDSGYTWEVPYISGVTSTTLTVAYLEDEIGKLTASRIAGTGKVVIPSYFTDYENGLFDYIFDAFSGLQEIESPWLYGPANALTFKIVPPTTAFTKSFIGDAVSNLEFASRVTCVYLVGNNLTINETDALSPIAEAFPNYTSMMFDVIARQWAFSGASGLYHYAPTGTVHCSVKNTSLQYMESGRTSNLYATNLTNNTNIYFGNSKVFCPALNTINSGLIFSGFTGSKKIFLGQSSMNITPPTGNRSPYNTHKAYLRADALVQNMGNLVGNATDLTAYGVLDGSGVYNNMLGGTSMNYPTLTGVDTESNIQSITPADGALYLASDTGNLWKYENSAWSNLFSGYTATWYSNEDCTTTVSASFIATTDTVYVKLTAI